MKLSSRALKAKARQTLAGKYSTAIGALVLTDLIYVLMIYFFVPVNLGGSLSLISTVCNLIVLFLTVILLAGTNFLYLNFARGDNYRISQIFYAFSHHPDRVILITVALFAVYLLCLLPSILVFVFVLTAHAIGGLNFASTVVILAVAAVLSLLLIFAIALKFSMVFYLYIDHPELNWLQLLNESRRLMRGSQLRYIRLMLSFLGMLLLCVLSLGLALLWVIPYISMTNTYFYLDLSHQQGEFYRAEG